MDDLKWHLKISVKNGGFNSKTTVKIMSKKSGQCSKNRILKILNDSSFSIKLFLTSHSQK